MARCLRCGATSEWIEGRGCLDEPRSNFVGAALHAVNEEVGKIAAQQYRQGGKKHEVATRLSKETDLSYDECERLIEAIDAYEDIREG